MLFIKHKFSICLFNEEYVVGMNFECSSSKFDFFYCVQVQAKLNFSLFSHKLKRSTLVSDENWECQMFFSWRRFRDWEHLRSCAKEKRNHGKFDEQKEMKIAVFWKDVIDANICSLTSSTGCSISPKNSNLTEEKLIKGKNGDSLKSAMHLGAFSYLYRRSLFKPSKTLRL